jgi:hypothetical protein
MAVLFQLGNANVSIKAKIVTLGPADFFAAGFSKKMADDAD